MKFQLKKSLKGQKGFTLVELSVVVLVAGLMLTAVMKGQSMLETARAQKLSNDLKNVEALIGNFETAKGRLPGDCNASGLVDFYLNTAASQTVQTALGTAGYGTVATDQTLRAAMYSNTGAVILAATAGTAATDTYCPAVTAALSEATANEADANIWINDLRAGNFIGMNTTPRLFAKHIGEDMMYVGSWGDEATGESYNAITLANVPAGMAQRVMQSINGSDYRTDVGQIRVINDESVGTYRADAFKAAQAGSVVNLVYFYRNQPRVAS